MTDEIQALSDVGLQVVAELGRTTRPVEKVLSWKIGDVVTLDTYAGAPLRFLVNGKVLGYGEIVVIDDKFAFRITKMVNPYKELKKA